MRSFLQTVGLCNVDAKALHISLAIPKRSVVRRLMIDWMRGMQVIGCNPKWHIVDPSPTKPCKGCLSESRRLETSAYSDRNSSLRKLYSVRVFNLNRFNFIMEYQRKKSCNQCRLSKTRCNLAKPHCQRCEKRNLTCKYEHQATSQASAASSNNDGVLFHSWVAGTKSTNPAPRAGVSQPEDSAGFDQDVRIEELLDFDIPMDADLDEMYTADMQWSNERAIPAPEGVPEREARRDTLSEKETRDDVCWYEFPGSASTRSPVPRQTVSITAEDGHHFNDFVLSVMKTLPSSPFDVPGVSNI
jgi:hypothetical protein